MGVIKDFICDMMTRVENETNDLLPGRTVNAVEWATTENGHGMNVSVYGEWVCKIDLNPYSNSYKVSNKQFTATFTGNDASTAAAQIVSWLLTEGDN